MKKEITAILLLATIIMAWTNTSISMHHLRSEDLDYLWMRCDYTQTDGSFQISIVILQESGNCPETIRYFPESDSWL